MKRAKKKVCIQGLGFVGSAMAIAVAIAKDSKGIPLYEVIGVDLPTNEGNKRVTSINNAVFPFMTTDENLNEALKEAINQGNLSATTDSSVYSSADIIIVDIHLDIGYLDDNPKLDLIDFKSAIGTIGHEISPETLIIIETTVPPGVCEKIVIPELHNQLEKRKINKDSVYIAHSYERVMPGKNYLNSITDFWRVYAGHNDKAADLCEEFLCSIINTNDFPLTRLSSITASETAKVMENTYRAVNIAFIDEWTKYSEVVGIDLIEVIEAIKLRPTHSNIRYPGLGVGGYCLTKDPVFAPASASQLFGKNVEFPFSSLAVKTNHNMPNYVIDRLKVLLGGRLSDKRILICGVSYRSDVADTRFSPSETLVRKLMQQNAIVCCHDPYVKLWQELNISITSLLPDAKDFDGIIFSVAHSEYHNLDLKRWVVKNNVIIDASMLFSHSQRNLVRALGAQIESIGRGNGL